MVNIQDSNVKKFMLKNIVTQFDISKILIF